MKILHLFGPIFGAQDYRIILCEQDLFIKIKNVESIRIWFSCFIGSDTNWRLVGYPQDCLV